MSLVDCLRDMRNPQKERPIHVSEQITSLGDLQVGAIFQEFNVTDGQTFPLRIIEITSILNKGYRCRVLAAKSFSREDFTLQPPDYAIIPYEDGLWNGRNYLIKADRPSK